MFVFDHGHVVFPFMVVPPVGLISTDTMTGSVRSLCSSDAGMGDTDHDFHMYIVSYVIHPRYLSFLAYGIALTGCCVARVLSGGGPLVRICGTHTGQRRVNMWSVTAACTLFRCCIFAMVISVGFHACPCLSEVRFGSNQEIDRPCDFHHGGLPRSAVLLAGVPDHVSYFPLCSWFHGHNQFCFDANHAARCIRGFDCDSSAIYHAFMTKARMIKGSLRRNDGLNHAHILPCMNLVEPIESCTQSFHTCIAMSVQCLMRGVINDMSVGKNVSDEAELDASESRWLCPEVCPNGLLLFSWSCSCRFMRYPTRCITGFTDAAFSGIVWISGYMRGETAQQCAKCRTEGDAESIPMFRMHTASYHSDLRLHD